MTTPAHRHQSTQPGTTAQMTRRQLMVYGGLSGAMALFAGCSRAAERYAIPFLQQPEEHQPGVASWYATICGACPAQCGVMAKVRDGRPIKLEGTPEHPLNRGGLCPVGQAAVRGLYDADRLGGPRLAGEAVSWSALDTRVREALQQARDGGNVVLVTPTITGPATRAAVTAFLETFEARHVIVDPAPSLSAIREAHRRTHGEARMPDYRFDRAHVVVGIEADFLGQWLMPAPFAMRTAEARMPERPGGMARHIQFESDYSLTGSNADERHTLAPSSVRAMLARLEFEVERALGRSPAGEAPNVHASVSAIVAAARDLAAHRGAGLVVCGTNDPVAQVLVNRINHALDNYGSDRPLDWRGALQLHQGDDDAFAKLVADADAGQVGALVMWDVNPVYDHPLGEAFAAALGKVPFSLALATHLDETASHATAVAPVPHWLESWGDGQPAYGLAAVSQPVLRPLTDCRNGAESLLRWTGRDVDFHTWLRAHWREHVWPAVAGTSSTSDSGDATSVRWQFDDFWRDCLHHGFVRLQQAAVAVPALQPARPSVADVADPDSDGLELVLVASSLAGSGRHANNPWLQECPEPVTRLTWDNAALLHPDTAAELELRNGDRVTVAVAGDGSGPSVTLPALLLPGMHRRTVGIWLGYGRTAAGEVGNGTGVNVAPLLEMRDGCLTGHAIAATVTRVGGNQTLGLAQTYDRQITPITGDHRRIVRETSFADWRADPHAGSPAHHGENPDIWSGHDYPGHHWAMVVDLTRCIGCGGCIMACQAENNIPTVGRDEVAKRRDMHWMRVDRYFSGGPDDPDPVHTSYMPLMCQQCDNAPCETVCPVAATTHSAEGLNEQVYNRCVGTRYCANNCPYKARRFNWFEYDRSDGTANLVLNPDVTVRSRGVMEKCTFCVQRISEAKHAARSEGRDVRDGDIVPACAQSCPTRAIVFGDDNDGDSTVARRQHDPRAWRLLEEVNTRPSVAYLTKVRNTRGGESAHAAERTSHEETTHE